MSLHNKKDQVWQKGRKINGLDENEWRLDPAGAIIGYDQYGNRESAYGWEIDHTFPEATSKDLGYNEIVYNDLDNLRPFHYKNNLSKGLDYPDYVAAVQRSGHQNIALREQKHVNSDVRKVVNALFKF